MTIPLDSPHFQEDLSELCPDLEEGVEVARWGHHSQRLKVVVLENMLLPRSPMGKHKLHMMSISFEMYVLAKSNNKQNK